MIGKYFFTRLQSKSAVRKLKRAAIRSGRANAAIRHQRTIAKISKKGCAIAFEMEAIKDVFEENGDDVGAAALREMVGNCWYMFECK